MTFISVFRRPVARRAALVVIAALAIGVMLVWPGGHSNRPSDRGAAGVTAEPSRSGGETGAARSFFDRYVTADGRVVRHDQGGDTVSEGQAYALLLAVGIHDEHRFDSVWEWTRHNLQRPDALLSWQWRDGAVVDRQPASDADVDAARALALAADEFDRPELRAEARRIAAEVLDAEVATAGGRSALAAGPWAVAGRTMNASYWSPCAAADLARVTGDSRWQRLAGDAVSLVAAATAGGTRLPSDWSRLDDNGTLQPIGSPGGSRPDPVYGFDAARIALRMAEPCAAGAPGRRLAAALWPPLQRLPGEASHEAYHLDGSLAVPPDARHPAGLVGAAAAATAAGDTAASDRLLGAGESLDTQRPTYYGAALLALARTPLPAEAPNERSFSPGALQLIAGTGPPPAESSTTATSAPPATTTTTGPATTTSTAPTTTTTTRPAPTTAPGPRATSPPTPTTTSPALTKPTGSDRPPATGPAPAAPSPGPAVTDGSAGAPGPRTLRPGVLTRPSAPNPTPPPAGGPSPSASEAPGHPEPGDEPDDPTPARTGVLLAGAGLTALLGTRLGRRSL